MDLSDTQFSNALLPMSVNPFPNVTDSRSAQPKNALSAIFASELGNVTFFKPFILANASASISVIPSASVISLMPSKDAKAFFATVF